MSARSGVTSASTLVLWLARARAPAWGGSPGSGRCASPDPGVVGEIAVSRSGHMKTVLLETPAAIRDVRDRDHCALLVRNVIRSHRGAVRRGAGWGRPTAAKW
jgi:hypothetical protein